MTKQTAVEFVFSEFFTGIHSTYSNHDINSILEEADELFKKQILAAIDKGFEEGLRYRGAVEWGEETDFDPEKYFEETYVSE